MRLLVLDDAGLVIPGSMVDAIEAIEDEAESAPWLPELVQSSGEIDGPRRALRLRSGGRVEVPATMHFIDGVDILELPESLRESAAINGVIGIAQVSGELLLVCDPNLLVEVGGRGE